MHSTFNKFIHIIDDKAIADIYSYERPDAERRSMYEWDYWYLHKNHIGDFDR